MTGKPMSTAARSQRLGILRGVVIPLKTGIASTTARWRRRRLSPSWRWLPGWTDKKPVPRRQPLARTRRFPPESHNRDAPPAHRWSAPPQSSCRCAGRGVHRRAPPISTTSSHARRGSTNIDIGNHGDRADAEFFARACDANRDLAAIGDQQRVKTRSTRHLSGKRRQRLLPGRRALGQNAARPSRPLRASRAHKHSAAKSSCACAVPRRQDALGRANCGRFQRDRGAGSARANAASMSSATISASTDMLGLLRRRRAGPRTAGALRAGDRCGDATNGAICAGGMPSPVSGCRERRRAVREHHVRAQGPPRVARA